jgi:hypothetical protein
MNHPTVLEAPAALLIPNQSHDLEFLGIDHLCSYSYPEAIAQLKDCGHMSLQDMQELSSTDLNNVFEEIKCWCVYGNHDPRKLKTVLNTRNL